jgi:hypothetical protein
MTLTCITPDITALQHTSKLVPHWASSNSSSTRNAYSQQLVPIRSNPKSESCYDRRQSASLSWNRAPIWGLRPDLYYCQTVAGLLMWGALSDERTGLLLATSCFWTFLTSCNYICTEILFWLAANAAVNIPWRCVCIQPWLAWAETPGGSIHPEGRGHESGTDSGKTTETFTGKIRRKVSCRQLGPDRIGVPFWFIQIL